MTPAEALVLVVDDDPDMRDLLALALRAAGLTPVLAEDGRAALALLESVVPDIILLDAVMPAPDGFETCRRIKQSHALAAIPVVFMTGLGETRHVIAGLQAGGVDYLTKPPLLEELVARLRVHIATSQMARSAQRALDAAGRKLVSTDARGAVRWLTPQAAELLASFGLAPADEGLAAVFRDLAADAGQASRTIATGARRLLVKWIGPATGDQFFSLKEVVEGQEAAMLRDALQITPREADVLRWLAAGKSNRDIGVILNISGRTVDKHVEQILLKLGVENRVAASIIAARILAVA